MGRILLYCLLVLVFIGHCEQQESMVRNTEELIEQNEQLINYVIKMYKNDSAARYRDSLNFQHLKECSWISSDHIELRNNYVYVKPLTNYSNDNN